MMTSYSQGAQINSSDDRKAVLRQIGFSGNAREYFGIWIVNVLLTLVTLGIYSAWAKVRRLTYFRNNTIIAGHGFGYHATGLQILKGRLLALAILVLLSVVSNFALAIAGSLSLATLFVMPWFLNNSLKFNARVTSYRNVRFNWHGTYWKTFWWLIVAPVAGLISLGVLIPLFSKHYYRYFASHHSYGTTRFHSNPTTGGYYFAFLVGAVIPTIAMTGLIGAFWFLMNFNNDAESLYPYLFFGFLVALPIAFTFSMSFIYRVFCRNLMLRKLTLSDVAAFDSDLHPGRFIWISLTNLVAVVVTIGLLLPWATVRMYRYLAHCTKISIYGDMEKFVDEERMLKSAFGQEFADFEGIDVSI